MRHVISTLLFVVCFIGITGCGGGSEPEVPENPVALPPGEEPGDTGATAPPVQPVPQ